MKPADPTIPENSTSAEREFPALQVTLRDARSVTIRAIRPDDAGAMRTALDGLSAEDRYSRFMATVKVSSALVERSVRPAGDCERALVAVAGEGTETIIAGGARYVSGRGDGDTCEFAVTTMHGWRGAGLASCLMRALIRDACMRGLKRMEGHVLAANGSMLGLARRLGFEIGESDEGPSVKLVRLDLGVSAAGPEVDDR